MRGRAAPDARRRSSHRLIVAAMARASRARGSAAPLAGDRQSSSPGSAPGAGTPAATTRRCPHDRCGRRHGGFARRRARRRRRLGLAEHRIDRLQKRLGGAERDFQRQLQPALLCVVDPLLEMPPHVAKSAAGRRAGSCRSTASRRRPQRPCAVGSRASSPAKNSSASAATISHCSGLVSCASSIRMWSSPPSSLNSTHGATPGRRSSASAFSTRSS